MTFEVTVEKIDEALLSETYGAKRVEVCSALDLGGLTPSIGLVQACLQRLEKTEVHVLVRPRPGNFVYSKEEVLIMLSDIQAFAELGVHGVVLGFLTVDGTIDSEVTRELVRYSKKMGLEVTFHRAIDFCADLPEAVSQLIDLEVDRILTSGSEETAIEGIENLRKMVAWSAGRIEIMAGSGVNANNAKELYALDIDALHFSIKSSLNPVKGMGSDSTIDEDKLRDLTELFKSNF